MSDESDVRDLLHEALDAAGTEREIPPRVVAAAGRRRLRTLAGVAALLMVAVAATVVAPFTLPSTAPTSPYPSKSELRTGGFAVWPEDTIQEGKAACEEPEPWRLEAGSTVLRFAREVLKYPEPDVEDRVDNPESGTNRYHVTTPTEWVYLGMMVDLRKFGSCWFVVGATPREGGYPATVTFTHPGEEPHIAVRSTASRTEVGFGTWSHTFTGREGTFDLSDVAPEATGHVTTFNCYRELCDVNAWPLGAVPEPAAVEPIELGSDEFAALPGVKRTGCSTRLKQLAELYAIAEGKSLGTSNSRPSVGKVVFRNEGQLAQTGIKEIGRDRWTVPLDDGRTSMEAQIMRIGDESCWNAFEVEDPRRSLLTSLAVSEESVTFDLSWGQASTARVGIGSIRGGDTYEFGRLEGPITITQLFATPLKEPFQVTVELRDAERFRLDGTLLREGSLIAREQRWYRVP